MSESNVETVKQTIEYFARPKKLSIDDLRLPWKPIYNLLSSELFPPKRKTDGRSVILVPSYSLRSSPTLILQVERPTGALGRYNRHGSAILSPSGN